MICAKRILMVVKSDTEQKECVMEDVFITDIIIKEVRHLKNIIINICNNNRKHLIFTGKNGSGKTSLLRAISQFLQSIPDNKFERIIKYISLSIREDKAISIDREQKDISEIKKYFALGYILILPNSHTIQELFNSGCFVIAFFNITRNIMFNIQVFIQYLINLKINQSRAREYNDIETVKRIDERFNLFEKSLCELFEDDTLKLVFDWKKYNFYIVKSGREIFDFFDTLSDSYSAILNIVIDLILRIGNNKQKGYDVNGIVLIDEIETHLHVELQKKILPFLTKFFPKIQFIVTTHSPFILNSLNDAVIYDLENKILVEDLSGYSYDGLIEGFFNVDKYSDRIKQQIKIYQSLIEKDILSESEREQMIDIRDYLKKIPSELAPELAYRFTELELLRRSKEKGKWYKPEEIFQPPYVSQEKSKRQMEPIVVKR